MTAVRQRTDHRSDALLIVDANDDPAAFAALYARLLEKCAPGRVPLIPR